MSVREVEVLWQRHKQGGSWVVRYTDRKSATDPPTGGAFMRQHFDQACRVGRELAEAEGLTLSIIGVSGNLIERKEYGEDFQLKIF